MPFFVGDFSDARQTPDLFAYNGSANIGMDSELEAARKSLFGFESKLVVV
jgi:hypothetical protein